MSWQKKNKKNLQSLGGVCGVCFKCVVIDWYCPDDYYQHHFFFFLWAEQKHITPLACSPYSPTSPRLVVVIHAAPLFLFAALRLKCCWQNPFSLNAVLLGKSYYGEPGGNIFFFFLAPPLLLSQVHCVSPVFIYYFFFYFIFFFLQSAVEKRAGLSWPRLGEYKLITERACSTNCRCGK